MQSNGVTQTPFARDIAKYTEIFKTFIEQFVETISEPQLNDLYNVIQNEVNSISIQEKTKTIVNFLLYHIVAITVWHQHIGSMAPYTFHPNACRVSVSHANQFDTRCLRHESIHGMIVTALTSRTRFPVLIDLPQQHCHRLKGNWMQLQAALKGTTFETDILQPQYIECSVAQ
jgi:hypothetical protein